MKVAVSSGIDPYSDASLRDPYSVYRQLRDLGSGVYLSSIDAYFIGRFSDVRGALADWQTFSSAQGIGLNPVINKAWEEALICQDPPVHTERRKLISDVLSPMALKPLTETIDARARGLADRLAEAGEFDGVADFAHDLPIGVVMDLIGWPEDVRPRLLKLAEGSWNAAGPDNERMRSGLTQLGEMMALIAEIYDNNRVQEGGFAAQLIGAAHKGLITRETAIGMLAGYIVAAFETTISAMAAGIYLFARNPDEWDKLRANPRLVASAANEIVRLESPLQGFSRVCTREVELSDDTTLPAGSRVILSYTSANHDERQFNNPEHFVIDRPEKLNLGFGIGPHGCAGQGLARMELMAVFSAMAARMRRIELVGEPERVPNNIARSFSRIPARSVV